MTAPNATDWQFSRQQWDAVVAVDRHILVSAGAGTGKTRTVVGRILFLLGVDLEPPEGAPEKTVGRMQCGIKDIGAITFTNAAAADLKRKLRRALLSMSRTAEAYEIELARIGTIHSFCLDLLREFALQAGANPRDEVVDEPVLESIRSQVTRDTILRVLEGKGVPGLATVLSRFSARQIREMVEDLLRNTDRLRRIAANENLPTPERAILDVALLAAAALDEELASSELIDFDRVIVQARDLLAEHHQIRSALRRRIKTLIIDEFQDVDPVQKEIAYLLGDPASGRSDTTRLMLVGDAKQSIYRFRRADVRVWHEVRTDFEQKGWGLVRSTTNSYRCSKQILGIVDSTIGRAFDTPTQPGGLQDFEVPFEALSTGTSEQDEGPPVEVIMLPANEKGKDLSSSDRRRLEVTAVAKRAVELSQEGYEWGEMAVLLRNWSMAPDYRDALEAVGVPAFSLRSSGFYEKREILDLLLALETLCDPSDDRALVGYLRSPFVGISDETLLQLRSSADGCLWEMVRPSSDQYGSLMPESLAEAEAERMAAGTAMLSHYAAMRDRKPVHELLEDLLYDTGYMAHLRILGHDEDEAFRNVMRLLRQSRKASRLSTSEFVAHIHRCREANRDDGEPITPRGDAVTISTVHSAKGLEWRIVFWGGLGLALNTRNSGRMIVGSKTIALRDPAADSQPENYESLQARLAFESMAEEKRLWYVAATRAIERLILCGISAARVGKQGSSQAADFLLQGLKNVAATDGRRFHYENAAGERLDGIVRVVDAPPSATAASVLEPPPPRALDTLPPIVDPVSVSASATRHSATEYLTFSACPRRHWFKYTLGIREPTVPERRRGSLIDALTRGLIVHDVLERLREESDLELLLDDAIQRRDQDAPRSGTRRGERYRMHLREEIERVANEPGYRTIADLPDSRRELAFLYLAAEDEYYEGSIDLAAVEANRLALLDVKTPQCNEEVARRKAELYEPQQDVYITAVEGIAGMRAGRFAFQFSRAQVQVSQPVDDRLRRRAAQSVSSIARRIEGEANTAAEDPLECRYCGFAPVGWCCGNASSD